MMPKFKFGLLLIEVKASIDTTCPFANNCPLFEGDF